MRGFSTQNRIKRAHRTSLHAKRLDILMTRVKYCAHFRVAPALIARKHVHAHTNVERRHITRLTISSAEARRTVHYADARPQSFTLCEEARSCLAALSRSTLLPVIVERHLVSGYYVLKLFFSRDTSASKGAAVRT